MENSNKMIVTRVNDFEFQLDKYNSNQTVLNDARASVALKVGNLIETITLYCDFYAQDKNEPSIKFWNGVKPFSALIEAGIELSFSDIFNEYKKLADKTLEKRKTFEENKKLEEYKNAWFHSIPTFIKTNKKLNGVECIIPEYKVDGYNSYTSCVLKYKDQTINLYKESYGRGYKSNYRYTYHPHFLRDSRSKWSTDLNKIIVKFKSDVELAIELKKIDEEKKNTKETEKQNNINKYKELFGFEIIAKEETKSYNTYRNTRRNNREYYTDITYYIVVNEKRNVTISEYQGNYIIAGLGSLTVEQVKGIINILKS